MKLRWILTALLVTLLVANVNGGGKKKKDRHDNKKGDDNESFANIETSHNDDSGFGRGMKTSGIVHEISFKGHKEDNSKKTDEDDKGKKEEVASTTEPNRLRRDSIKDALKQFIRTSRNTLYRTQESEELGVSTDSEKETHDHEHHHHNYKHRHLRLRKAHQTSSRLKELEESTDLVAKARSDGNNSKHARHCRHCHPKDRSNTLARNKELEEKNAEANNQRKHQHHQHTVANYS